MDFSTLLIFYILALTAMSNPNIVKNVKTLLADDGLSSVIITAAVFAIWKWA